MKECPECGSSNVTSSLVAEARKWGKEKLPFTVTYHVDHCECGFSFVGPEGAEEEMLCQFRFEKSIGVVRTRFVGAHDRSLWEQA